jgi:hypothetical protein
MNDKMAQRDAVNVALQCGHPNVKEGEKCPLCGNIFKKIGHVIKEGAEKVVDGVGNAIGEAKFGG